MNDTNQLPANEDVLVLDDAKYFLAVAFSTAYNDADAPAYLHLRDVIGQTCIGSCIQNLDGTWQSRLNVILDDESSSDSLLVGDFDSRVDGIVHLWQQRKKAFCI
ncbi:hypothetical protein [Comamonas aquatica]|uniref:hypothetical protein n=1 Tax=Comamonas aquatica TaxID=225991 RepID=UPI003CFC3897